MLPHPRELLSVFEHTLVLYVALILGLRILGRRQMGQLTVVDLVIILLLGSAVETAMIAGKTSLIAGLVSAATLLFLNRLLAAIFWRSRRLRHLVVGQPVLLVHNGHFVEENLKRVGLLESEVSAAIRERGFDGINDARFVVLESDGSINVVPTGAPVHRTRETVRKTPRRSRNG